MYTRYKCPKCGYVFDGEVKYCPNCGQLFKYPSSPLSSSIGTPTIGSGSVSTLSTPKKKEPANSQKLSEGKKKKAKRATAINIDEESHATGEILKGHIPLIKRHLRLSLSNAIILLILACFVLFAPIFNVPYTDNGESKSAAFSALSMTDSLIKTVVGGDSTAVLYSLFSLYFFIALSIIILIAIIVGIVSIIKNAKRLKDPYKYAYDYYCFVLERDAEGAGAAFMRMLFSRSKRASSVIWNAFAMVLILALMVIFLKIPYFAPTLAYSSCNVLYLVIGAIIFVIMSIIAVISHHSLSIYKQAILDNKSANLRKHFD